MRLGNIVITKVIAEIWESGDVVTTMSNGPRNASSQAIKLVVSNLKT